MSSCMQSAQCDKNLFRRSPWLSAKPTGWSSHTSVNAQSSSWEVHMDSSSSPSGSSAYFESLMRAGQQSMKQFDDALASAMGVEGKGSTREDRSPFAVAANLQQQYWSQIVGFWKDILFNASATGAQPARRDRRFQDEAWQHSPYYDLIKHSYLAASK